MSTLLFVSIFVSILGLPIFCLYLGYALGEEPYEEQVWPDAEAWAAWVRTLRVARWAWVLLLIVGLPWAILAAPTLQAIIAAAAHAGSALLLRELGRAQRTISAAMPFNEEQA